MAELKDLLGSDYHDGMTLEEVSAALASKSFVAKATFDKTASDLAAAKHDNDALKTGNQTADEKLSAALAEMQKQSKAFTLKSNRLEIEQLFTSEGIKRDEYGAFIDAIVSEDLEHTKGVASEIVKTIKAQKAAAETALKNELLKTSPKPGQQTPPATMTKTDFAKMTVTEQMKFKYEHPTEYAQIK